MSNCALDLDNKPKDTCLDSEHVSLISKYTEGNSLAEIKKETNCNTDSCILDNVKLPTQIKGKIEREAFKAPTGSFDHNYWLNNTEIDTVMTQMRKQYPGFGHGFIHMIDVKSFPPSNIDTIDYKVLPANELNFGKEFKHALIRRGLIQGNPNEYTPMISTYNNTPLKSYGIVCNTDSSKGSGQHWFVIFISSDQKDPNDTSKPWIRIELFNSGGGGTTNTTFNTFWQQKALEIAKETGVRCTFDVITSIQHQSPDTGNCGAYSLFYIYARLRGELPTDFNNPNRPIRDYAMKKFREVCFRLDKDSNMFAIN